MKFGAFLLVFALFYSTGSCTGNEDELNSGRKRLDDLDGDVLFLICDELDIDDVLNLVSAYPAKILFDTANGIFRTRYRDISIVHIDHRDDLNRIDFDNKTQKVMVSPNKCLKFLRHFGGSIQHLEIEYPSNITTPLINEYSSDALSTLKMNYVELNTFSYFTKPFTKLQSLSLMVFGDVDFNYTTLKNFPLLKHFEVKDSFYFANDRLFDEFFRKNPQIGSLEISRLTQDTCDIINEHLLNLESLNVTINDFRLDDETTFEHVKHFSVGHLQWKSYDSGPGSMDKLHFPRLEKLQIKFDPFTEIWGDFCRKHQSVTKLEILGVYIRTTEELNMVLDNLPNLESVTLKSSTFYTYRISPEIIFKIIDGHQRLVRLNLSGFHLYENVLNNLRARFANGWDITAVEDARTSAVDLSIVMKNSTEVEY